jgi:hypothetical protein
MADLEHSFSVIFLFIFAHDKDKRLDHEYLHHLAFLVASFFSLLFLQARMKTYLLNTFLLDSIIFPSLQHLQDCMVLRLN